MQHGAVRQNRITIADINGPSPLVMCSVNVLLNVSTSSLSTRATRTINTLFVIDSILIFHHFQYGDDGLRNLPIAGDEKKKVGGRVKYNHNVFVCVLCV